MRKSIHQVQVCIIRLSEHLFGLNLIHVAGLVIIMRNYFIFSPFV